MKNYRFIKITDNDDHRNFHIDFTSMSDYRIRVSILWSKYLNYLDKNTHYRSVYDILDSDWSAYCVYRGSFSNMDAVKRKQDEFVEHYVAKLKDYKPQETSCIVSFY